MMKTLHPQYKLRPNDTIAHITQLFGIEEEVWLQYHNNMCHIDNIIINNKIPEHLTEIYLLPELWDKENELNTVKPQIHPLFNEQEKIILYNKDILFFAPYNINNRYGVIMDFDQNKIHYEIEVKYVMSLTPELFRISIDRKQVYVNNEEPSTKFYEIADLMAKSIYPIVLDIDRNKKIQTIANYKEIQTRGADTCKKIFQYYVGEYVEKYILLFEKHISNPNILMNNIENELFYQLFFLPIQGKYNTDLTKKSQYSHTSNANQRTYYNLNIKLRENYTESEKISASIYSDEMVDKERCFEAEYRFYPEDHAIFSMRGNLIVLDDKKKKNNTYFEIYHINPQDRVIKRDILSNKQSVIIEEYNKKETQTLPKKKKSFWNFFK